MGYSDVLNMPTNERRFHIGMLLKNKSEENERMSQVKHGKGTKTRTISGDALKTQIKNGRLPLN